LWALRTMPGEAAGLSILASWPGLSEHAVIFFGFLSTTRTMPNERPKLHARIVLDPNNTPTVIDPLGKGVCAGNRRGKVHYLGTTAVDNLWTNHIFAVAAY
jgi:hypothetical protein